MLVCYFLTISGLSIRAGGSVWRVKITEEKTDIRIVIAGFFTGGALAIRGGAKAARNSAIGCAVLLGVIEGVGIGFQRMMAGNTKLEVWISSPISHPFAN